VHPRVLRAMSTPLLGHLDPEFLTIMNEVQALLRTVFQTDNPFTIAVSGTGSAGMEAALVNLIEPGDTVIVGVNGVFGARMADVVASLAGVPVRVDAWGIDACYSGTQKCLSCPPGLAPLTLSPRALAVVKGRKTKVQSWYLDLSMIADYWAEGKRAYHHTAPI